MQPLDDVRRRKVPVPRHHRPANAPEAEFFGGRDDLWPVPAVRDAEQVGEGASCVVDGFLATLQLFPDRARTAPDEVRVIVGVVGNNVPGGDLGGEVRFATDVVPDLEEGRPYSLAGKDLE
jgi:hypothetical protein